MFDFLSPDMVYHPYPLDHLSYRSDRVVRYRTLPRSEGLGTTGGRLNPSDRPIEGVVALLGEMPEIDLLLLSVRLPPEMETLGRPIIQQLELEAVTEQPPNQPR